MKLRNFLIIPACLLFALFSCQKDWLDVNTNPNSLPSSTPDYTFAAAANRLAATLGPNELGEYWSGHWTQSSTYILSATYFKYEFNNTNFDYWSGYYDILEDLDYATKGATGTLTFFWRRCEGFKSVYLSNVGGHVWEHSLYRWTER